MEVDGSCSLDQHPDQSQEPGAFRPAGGGGGGGWTTLDSGVIFVKVLILL